MKLPTLFTLISVGTSAAAPSKAIKARNPIDDSAPHIDDHEFIGRIMDAHWYWRRIHCAQDLQWDPTLAQAALDSVNVCTDMPQHDRGGSNLSSRGPAPADYNEWLEFARTVVHGWHEEETKYPYDKPGYEDAWGHFTQLVWRESSRIGCAMAHCPDNHPWPARLYCFYETAGNNIAGNLFAENVWGPVCPDPSKVDKTAALGHE